MYVSRVKGLRESFTLRFAEGVWARASLLSYFDPKNVSSLFL